MEYLLTFLMNLLIRSRRRHHARHATRPFNLKNKIRLFLVGYVGARNTGADVRVAEMVKQFNQICSPEKIMITVATMDKALSKNYFPHSQQVQLPMFFPFALSRLCHDSDGVVACEGSMFKSKFSDALTLLMSSALGFSNAENKFSLGYGAEAGHMNDQIKKFVSTHVQDSIIIARNAESRVILDSLGIYDNYLGTDTAWTFETHNPEVIRKLLMDSGWDGRKKILTVCPINPFCWPVKPSITKYMLSAVSRKYQKEKYKSFYFFEITQEKQAAYQRYLYALAEALNKLNSNNGYFTVIVGMERIDFSACHDLKKLLQKPVPVFASRDYDMNLIIGILRQSSFLCSSRYHAIVCTMPYQIPSMGISMDERINNLMSARQHQSLCLSVNDPALNENLCVTLPYLFANAEKISHEISRVIPTELERMGKMGILFKEKLMQKFPGFSPQVKTNSWLDHLPPLSSRLQKILKDYT